MAGTIFRMYLNIAAGVIQPRISGFWAIFIYEDIKIPI
jgi:hypothetical protein